MFLGKLTTFSNRVDFDLYAYTPLNDQFLSQLLGMTSLKYKKHWMRIIFSGGCATPPNHIDSDNELSNEMCRVKNSIGFIAIEKVSDCMKFLVINSHLPGDEGYLFADDSSEK